MNVVVLATGISDDQPSNWSNAHSNTNISSTTGFTESVIGSPIHPALLTVKPVGNTRGDSQLLALFEEELDPVVLDPVALDPVVLDPVVISMPSSSKSYPTH